MTISYDQPMRESLKATMDAFNNELPETIANVSSSLQADITAESRRAVSAEDTLTQLYGQLASIVNTIPDFEYGFSEAVSIPAASTVSVTITFSKTFAETPQVFTEVMCNTLNNILVSHVTYADTTKCTVKLYNGGSAAVSNVTVDYLALAGR